MEFEHDAVGAVLGELNENKLKVEKKQEEAVDITTKQKNKVKSLKRKRKQEHECINKLKQRKIQLSIGDVRDEVKKKSITQQKEITEHQEEITKLKTTIKDLENEIIETNDPTICKICTITKWNVIIQCGHTVCKECRDKINKCHICRGPMITQTIPKLIF